MITATPADWTAAQKAHERGQMQIQWPDRRQVRMWAKQHGWPTPIFGFEDAFISTLLKTHESFSLGLTSGIVLTIPRSSYLISAGMLADLDALYAERSSTGRPSAWGTLVEELREIRRAVEAGVIVTVEGVTVEGNITLNSFAAFYSWAHGRYHMLEDGYDRWIGDDG